MKQLKKRGETGKTNGRYAVQDPSCFSSLRRHVRREKCAAFSAPNAAPVEMNITILSRTTRAVCKHWSTFSISCCPIYRFVHVYEGIPVRNTAAKGTTYVIMRQRSWLSLVLPRLWHTGGSGVLLQASDGVQTLGGLRWGGGRAGGGRGNLSSDHRAWGCAVLAGNLAMVWLPQRMATVPRFCFLLLHGLINTARAY